MKKIIFIFLTIIMVVSACKNNKTSTPDNKDNSGWEFDKLSIKKELFVNNDSTRKGMKLNMELNYPSSFHNDTVLKQIQSSFAVAFAGDEYKGMNPKQAFEAYEKKMVEEGLNYGKEAIADGPDFGEYFENIATTVFDTTRNIITAKTEMSSYTGGAHGSSLTNYYNIDLKNGKILHEQDVFAADSTQLANLIKEYVKQSKNTTHDPVTILDENDVNPNGNFYFDKKGVVYVYNQYEIAPYSDGTIEVVIPYDKIEGLIKPQYKTLIKMD